MTFQILKPETSKTPLEKLREAAEARQKEINKLINQDGDPVMIKRLELSLMMYQRMIRIEEGLEVQYPRS